MLGRSVFNKDDPAFLHKAKPLKPPILDLEYTLLAEKKNNGIDVKTVSQSVSPSVSESASHDAGYHVLTRLAVHPPVTKSDVL